MKLIRTNSENIDFAKLVSQLNRYLKVVDGDDHDFYMQYNNIEALNNVVIAYLDNIPVGCGAFKSFNDEGVEIKRMFTSSDHRNQQIASKILKELELWAKEIGYNFCVLETGKRQVEAVNFYKKNNYKQIDNFGPYKGVNNSICFEKELK